MHRSEDVRGDLDLPLEPAECVGVVDLIYRSLTLPFKNYNSICGVCVKFYFHCIVLVFLDVEKLFEN